MLHVRKFQFPPENGICLDKFLYFSHCNASCRECILIGRQLLIFPDKNIHKNIMNCRGRYWNILFAGDSKYLILQIVRSWVISLNRSSSWEAKTFRSFMRMSNALARLFLLESNVQRSDVRPLPSIISSGEDYRQWDNMHFFTCPVSRENAAFSFRNKSSSSTCCHHTLWSCWGTSRPPPTARWSPYTQNGPCRSKIQILAPALKREIERS